MSGTATFYHPVDTADYVSFHTIIDVLLGLPASSAPKTATPLRARAAALHPSPPHSGVEVDCFVFR